MPTDPEHTAEMLPLRVAVVGDTCVSQAGLETIVGRDKRYQIVGGTHGYCDVDQLIRKQHPNILLIEPFLGNRDGILWIKELAKAYPKMRILIVSRQSERTYAERALGAGAAGYWMKNGSVAELMRAVEAIADGEIYTSRAVTALAVERFARRRRLAKGVDTLSDRELSIFSLIAAGRGPGEIAREFGNSRKTIETHCNNIKRKLGYKTATELKAGARKLMGEGEVSARLAESR